MCNQATHNPRTCVICKRPLVGRSDKVFCDIKCKNYYHSEARKSQRTAYRQTNAILAKNYIILAGLMSEGYNKAVISKLALVDVGFNFQYVTEVIPVVGEFRFAIYDIVYRWGRNNQISLETDPERSSISPFVFERWSRVYQPTKGYRKWKEGQNPTKPPG